MTHTSFLGIPVEGDINAHSERAVQRPLEELEPLMRAVLDDPTIASIGWTQYTPYFNDGEPCVFNVHETWFRTVDDPAKPDPENDDDEDEDEEDDDRYALWGSHPTLGHRDYNWVDRERVYKPYEGPDEARYDRCLALSQAIDSGAFDDVLLAAFGDHARVTVRSTGITVETYEHD